MTIATTKKCVRAEGNNDGARACTELLQDWPGQISATAEERRPNMQ